MNSVALTGVRNFPITTDALAFMQGAYGMLENFSKLAGDNYILSGCTVTGASVSSGMVVIGGRLMPFAGGSIQENVKVVTTVTPVTVGGGTREQTSFSAEFGTSTNPADNVAWSTLSANRIDNMLTLKQAVASNKNKVDLHDLQFVDKQAQLDILNRAQTVFIGSVSHLGVLTIKMKQPGFEISTIALTQPNGIRVVHNIGHTNYHICANIDGAYSNVFFSGVSRKFETQFEMFCNNTADEDVAMSLDFMIVVYPFVGTPDHGE